LEIDELIPQLKNKKSANRRSAAKKIRKSKNVVAGPFLLEAIKNEIKDSRTWETQYQIIMAIGECDFKEALPYLIELSKKPFEATFVYTAIGDAIVRLSNNNEYAKAAVQLFDTQNESLIDGGLRAIAMMRIVPTQQEVSQIIKFVSKFDRDDGIRFWVIAACPGWSGSEVDAFIEDSMKSTRSDFKVATELAKQKKYKKWNPA
jgi:HEAT repeat protein